MSDMDWNKHLLDKIAAQDVILEQQAAQIAEKDAEIARLTECLSKANANHEHFERAWYLRGDEVEALRADAERLRAALNVIASWGEGPDVDGEFDEPWSATTARAALRQEQPTKGEGA